MLGRKASKQPNQVEVLKRLGQKESKRLNKKGKLRRCGPVTNVNGRLYSFCANKKRLSNNIWFLDFTYYQSQQRHTELNAHCDSLIHGRG
ncbi:cell division protein FtsZ [Bacillus sp. SG-1]|nr:cell division protein FtsZ [Bacillus sp. SG-1]